MGNQESSLCGVRNKGSVSSDSWQYWRSCNGQNGWEPCAAQSFSIVNSPFPRIPEVLFIRVNESVLTLWYSSDLCLERQPLTDGASAPGRAFRQRYVAVRICVKCILPVYRDRTWHSWLALTSMHNQHTEKYWQVCHTRLTDCHVANTMHTIVMLRMIRMTPRNLYTELSLALISMVVGYGDGHWYCTTSHNKKKGGRTKRVSWWTSPDADTYI